MLLNAAPHWGQGTAGLEGFAVSAMEGPDWKLRERAMADLAQNGDKNMKEHVKTYSGVMAMMKWGSVLVMVVLAAMALFLV